MRITSAIAVIGLWLFGWFAPAWGAEPTGAAFCVTCHDEEDLPDMSASPHSARTKKPPMASAAEALGQRPMGDTVNARTPDCISCHGPSETHARKPSGVSERPRPDRTFGKTFGKVSQIPAQERSQACQSCHDKDSKRALWVGSLHQTSDVACDSCHQVHTNRDKVLSKVTQTDVCYACPQETRAQMSRPSHHPVPEGR